MLQMFLPFIINISVVRLLFSLLIYTSYVTHLHLANKDIFLYLFLYLQPLSLHYEPLVLHMLSIYFIYFTVYYRYKFLLDSDL